LSKVFGNGQSVPEELVPFFDAVDEAYLQSDHDRELLERSLDLTSNELLQANRELREYATDLEERVAERTAELRATNESLELEIAERIAAEAAISESEERYRSLFESSKDAIYISTPEGQLIDINPAGVELFGYESATELLMVDVARDLYRHPEHRKSFLERVNREGFVRDGELEIVRNNGEVLHVLDTTTAVRDEEGEVIAYRGILRDVTVQRRLEQELIQAQKMEAVGRLAGGVAHDFNNLLTAILAYAERLAMGLPPDDTNRTCVEAISNAAERGSALTSRLLAFGRRQVLRPVRLDLTDVVTDMRGLLRQVIPEDVDLVLNLEPELQPIQIDPTQIEQVILNLAMNAGDAMPNGGRLTIRTSMQTIAVDSRSTPLGLPHGSYARLSVEDTGIGIEESDREHIFEPFFTTKSSTRGTGLGLATVYSAVQQTGGSVAMTTEIGEGTCFDVYLPVVDGAPDLARTESQKAPAAAGSERILLVEDDPSVRQVLSDYLEDQGYSVFSAGDGAAGLDLARREQSRVDLVLTDVVMPRMNGIELARCLLDEIPKVKVLLISGHTKDRKRIVEQSLKWPTCSFLQKPFTPNTLVTRIRELLDA
jgi:PAS domain S-box-containing protein